MKKIKVFVFAAAVTAFVGVSNPVVAQTSDNTTTATADDRDDNDEGFDDWGLLGLAGLLGLLGRKRNDHTHTTTTRRD